MTPLRSGSKPNRADASPRIPPSLLGEIQGLAEDRIREFRKVEFDEGLVLQVKELDFKLSVPTRDWMQGAPLDRIKNDTSVSEGDLIRQFRMAIQLMRQIRSRVKGDGDLADRFAAAIEMMDRDEVDARRQLELG